MKCVFVAGGAGRQDAGSDLQLILGLNVLLVLAGSVAKKQFVDPVEGEHTNLWIDVYDVSFRFTQFHSPSQNK